MQSFQYRTQFEKFNLYHQQYLDAQQDSLPSTAHILNAIEQKPVTSKVSPSKKPKSYSYVNIQPFDQAFKSSGTQVPPPVVKSIRNKYFINNKSIQQNENVNYFQEVVLGQTKPISFSFGERSSQQIGGHKQIRYEKSTMLKMNAFCAEITNSNSAQKTRLQDEVKKIFPLSFQRQKQIYLIRRLSSALQRGEFSQKRFIQDLLDKRSTQPTKQMFNDYHRLETEPDIGFAVISDDQIRQDMQISSKSIHHTSRHQSNDKMTLKLDVGELLPPPPPLLQPRKLTSYRQQQSYRMSETRKVQELAPAPYGLYREFLVQHNVSNNVIVTPQETQSPCYKAIIGKGNNGIVVRMCLKQRWWWTLVDRDTPLGEVNMIWNQNRKLEYYNHLPKSDDLLPFSEDKSYGWVQRDDKRKSLEQHARTASQGSVSTTNEFHTTEQCDRTLIIHRTINMKSHNHLEKNFQITNKKALFYNISNFYVQGGRDPFRYIPLTLHIKEGAQDPEFTRFTEIFKQRQEGNDANYVNLWILKPGENSNRGNGIEDGISEGDSGQWASTHHHKQFIMYKGGQVQEYIQRPLLYCKRKFDIRCFMLMTATNNIIKGYWYGEGYIRTSSREFSVKNLENKMIHLTNDAIQKKGEEYGKYESGNKVSFNDFGKYVEEKYPKIEFQRDIVNKLKSLTKDVIGCGYELMDPQRRLHTFELFGLDFMIDENFNSWLIEVNNNPCLETTCSLLNRLIPTLIENVFRVALDPMYPPPTKIPKSKLKQFNENYCEQNKFELIFDSVGSTGNKTGNINFDDDEEIDE